MGVQVALSTDDSHWYAMGAGPPLAAVVLVRAAGAAPAHRVWSVPMVPATNAGATVMVTTLETAGAQALPELARRRK